MPSVTVDVDLSDVLDDLDCFSKRELKELYEEVKRKLYGKNERELVAPLPDIDEERAYRALQHMRAGETEDARWELERAFNPPVSDILRGAFTKPKAGTVEKRT